MNIEQCVEPLVIAFQAEIDHPLSLTDIHESLLLARDMLKAEIDKTEEFSRAYVSTLHHHFDIQDSTDLVSNLQLRAIIATVNNLYTLIGEDESYDFDVFSDISDILPELFVSGAEVDLTDIQKQQLKLRLAGIAPTYKLNSMNSTDTTVVEAYFKELVSVVEE